MCISIWWTDHGSVHSEFMSSIIKLLNDDSADRKLICSIGNRSGSSLSLNRNSAMSGFLETGCDYGLFVDADTIWSKELLYNLYDKAVDNNIDLLSGTLMYYNDGLPKPIAFIKNGDGIQHAIINKNIESVDYVGMGGILISRSAIQKTMQTELYGQNTDPFWFSELSLNGFIGEDMFFFDNVRKNGFDVKISKYDIVPHIKKKVLGSKEFYISKVLYEK